MADSYVCSGAIMKCTMGTSTAKLTVLPTRKVYLTGQPVANISDHKSMVNLAPFGLCRSLAFPQTAAATAAASGTLTPTPCMHNTPTPWMVGKMDFLIKGQPALLKSCTCQCMWGGTISLITDGQEDTGPTDMSRDPKTIINEEAAKEACIRITQDFFNSGKYREYKRSPECREQLAIEFYNGIKESLGIDAEISFVVLLSNVHGQTNYPEDPTTIELNSGFLDNRDYMDLLYTVLHESRHAFQIKAIKDPDSVSVDPETIELWAENYHNYIQSEWGYEEYRNQPIEKDANDFADTVMDEALNGHPFLSIMYYFSQAKYGS